MMLDNSSLMVAAISLLSISHSIDEAMGYLHRHSGLILNLAS